MKLSKCIRGMKLTIIILAALSLPMMTSPLLAEEPNQSDTDSVEQAVEAITKLRARAKAIKDRIEEDLRNRKAQHKREWKDATSSDPKEVQQAEQRVGLMRKTIWALGKVAPVITEFRREGQPNKSLYLSLSRNGTIPLAFTEHYQIYISSKGKIVWPSAAEIWSRSMSELELYYEVWWPLWKMLYGPPLQHPSDDDIAVFILADLPKHETLPIRVLGNNVSARKEVSKGIRDREFVDVTFPYNNMNPSLERAKKDLRNARAKFRKALNEMRDRQGDESREYGLMKKQVDSLDKELRRTSAALKRAGAIPQEFDDKLQKLNELVEETDADVAEKSAIIQAKYGHITKTKDDVDIVGAIDRGQLGRAKRILKKDPALVNQLDGEGRTTLHRAVRKDAGNAMIGLLIDEGADINAKDRYDKTPLHWAVEKRWNDVLDLLLRKGADVEARDNLGRTAVHYAAVSGHKGTLEALIANGADLNAKDNYGCTPVYRAVENSSYGVVEALLAAGADVNVQDQLGRTVLHKAAENGSKKVMSFLVRNGADINAKDKYGQTALHYAVDNGRSDLVEILVANGADVNAKDNNGRTPLDRAIEKDLHWMVEILGGLGEINVQGLHGRTVLHKAAENGSKKLVSVLVRNGADINAKDIHDQTALHYAADEGHADLAEILIANGADINAKDKYGRTPLHKAARRGHKDIAGLLIARGADVNAKDRHDKTALHYAVDEGHADLAEILIAKGADVSAKTTEKGSTVLHYAADKGHTDLAEILIANGADVNAKDERGMTPLSRAIWEGYKDVAEILIANGADVNAKDRYRWTVLLPAEGSKNMPASLMRMMGAGVEERRYGGGSTPLHHAADKGYTDVAEILIAKGADVNAKDERGLTPLSRAIREGHKDVAELLRKHGAVSGEEDE